MVSKRGTRYRFPATPQPAGRLIESSLMLWLASWRSTFWPAVLYSGASMLPLLTLGDLGSRVLQSSLGVLLASVAPWLPLPTAGDPLELARAALAWLCAPSTWGLMLVASLLALAGITLVIHRQWDLGIRAEATPAASWRAALSRLPAATGAWVVYAAMLGLSALPLLGLTVLVFHLGVGAEVSTLMMLFCLYLLGALALSLPLVWISVAAGFAPFASTIGRDGPFAAQRISLARVRGHWTHSAVVFSVPMLVYLGIGSTVSTLVLVGCAGLAFALGGWPALIAGDWLAWSQLVAAVPMAIAFPLAFAGGVVCWHDLELRAALRETVSAAG